MTACELCTQDGGTLIHRDGVLRIVAVNEPDYPGLCRVIINAHLRELTDLDLATRQHVMAAVWAVEETQRELLAPHKINVASLGNLTPHVHWHVIPRFEDDAHFPQPIWGVRQRESNEASLSRRRAQAQQLPEAIRVRLFG